MKKILVKILILAIIIGPLSQVVFAITQATPDCGAGDQFSVETGQPCATSSGGSGANGGTINRAVPDCAPGDIYSVETGQSCSDAGNIPTGGTPNGDNGGTSTPASYAKSKLFVRTGDADNITLTSATLRGTGGDTVPNPTLPITAYFRYSTLPIKPVFCNDVYSSNMRSTGDLDLGVSSSQNFYQNVYNLQPDTTYYYCAIVSNKDVVAILSSGNLVKEVGAVKQFHTDCLTTTADTKEATNIGATGATLNGAYCSTKNVKTSFQYKKSWNGQGTQPPWTKIGEVSRSIGSKSNIYGNYSYNLSSLAPSTKYDFQAVAENSGTFFYGNTFNFVTFPQSGSGGTGGSGNSGGTGGVGAGGVNTGGTGGSGSGGSGGGVNTGTGSGVGTGTSGGGVNTGGDVGGVNTGGGTGGVNTGGTGSGVGTGTWGSGVNGGGTGGSGSGSWGSGAGSGTWAATNGTGGVGIANWTSANGICTWSSATGSGTATGCPDGSGTWNHLVLGAHSTPPVDAVVRFQEGIETVFTRQIVSNSELAKKYGYTSGADIQSFAWDLSDLFARMFGYVTTDRREIRVSLPDVAAYQLVLIGDQLTVYEYYGDTIVDIRNMTTAFKSKAYYEYYFRKQ